MCHIMKVLFALICAVGISSAKGGNIEDAKPPREFSLLPADVKTNICQSLLKGVSREDVFLGLVQMFPEDRIYETWRDLSCVKEDFLFMRKLGFRHTRVIRTFEMSAHKNLQFSTNQPSYFQLRNPSDWERLGRTKWVGGRCLYAPSIIDFGRSCLFVYFERLKKHEWDAEDAFTDQAVCERPVKDWSKSVRELWRTSAYGILSNCAFSVDRRHGLSVPALPEEAARDRSKRKRVLVSNREFVDSIYRAARVSENWNPLIELSEREATEIVYLTALCRGRVRTMDEFNAAFVPKGETFLVRLTVPECETEIGRMLYDLARKRGLFGRKGG